MDTEKNFGKEYMGIERSTFIINKEGMLVKEYRKVRVKGHVEEALSFIKEKWHKNRQITRAVLVFEHTISV